MIFYDGHWIRPVSQDGVFNYDYFNEKIEELKEYANTSGIYGIHYDYLKFSGSEFYHNAGYQNPGGKEAIVYFVNESIKAIHEINPDLFMSAAIMPEPDILERIYGVDYSQISGMLDAIIPMIYLGNYHKDVDWLENTTRWFVENSNGAEVWSGIQGYSSADYNEEIVTEAPLSQLNIDIQDALDSNASGVIVFRYGISQDIDFNNVS